jgi:outer membrane biosynthesis protein TonB
VEDIPQVEIEVAPEPVTTDLGPPAAEPVVETIEPVEIAPVDSAPEPEQQEEQMAEARIEAEMEPEPEPEPEPQEQEPEEQEEQDQPETVEPEPQEQEPEPQSEPEPEPEPEPEEQEQSEPETQQERRKEAAEKAVAKIAPSQRYSAASQTTTIVAMGMISPKLITGTQIPDTQGFFTDATVPDGPPLSNPAQDYVVFGTSNAAHEAFVRLQWSK